MISSIYLDIVYNSVLVTGPISSYSAHLHARLGLGKTVKNILRQHRQRLCLCRDRLCRLRHRSLTTTTFTRTATSVTTTAPSPPIWLPGCSFLKERLQLRERRSTGFISNSDLHATAGICDNAGQALRQRHRRHRRETRNRYPDIGADDDVAVRRDRAPSSLSSSCHGDCGSSNGITVHQLRRHRRSSNFGSLSGGGSGSRPRPSPAH